MSFLWNWAFGPNQGQDSISSQLTQISQIENNTTYSYSFISKSSVLHLLTPKIKYIQDYIDGGKYKSMPEIKRELMKFIDLFDWKQAIIDNEIKNYLVADLLCTILPSTNYTPIISFHFDLENGPDMALTRLENGDGRLDYELELLPPFGSDIETLVYPLLTINHEWNNLRNKLLKPLKEDFFLTQTLDKILHIPNEYDQYYQVIDLINTPIKLGEYIEQALWSKLGNNIYHQYEELNTDGQIITKYDKYTINYSYINYCIHNPEYFNWKSLPIWGFTYDIYETSFDIQKNN